MYRDVCYGECLIGVDGLALLRLHGGLGHVSPGAVDEVMAELRTVLGQVDEPPFNRPARGRRLDVIEGYARWAPVYDEPGNPVVEHEQPVVWSLVERSPGEPILDAACGTGRHLVHLAKAGRRVIGVDLSAEMLAAARVKAPEAGLARGDVLSLPVGDGAVAGAVCALALEHVADLGRVYAELARVVGSGGWLVVSVLHPTIVTALGWHAWFVDGDGRGDVATYPYSLSDHLNAALAVDLRLVEIVEPMLRDNAVRNMAPNVAPVGSVIALRDMPVVMVCKFQRT